MIMKSPESTTHEGKVKLKVYTSLDSLYTSIFQAAFLEKRCHDDAMVRSVLSAVVLATNPLSPSAIATLMGFRATKSSASSSQSNHCWYYLKIPTTLFNHSTSPSLTSSQTQLAAPTHGSTYPPIITPNLPCAALNLWTSH
jgi:hypothetical protein